MTTLLRVIGTLCLICLASFTGSKLVKMAKVRGLISGPVPQFKTVTDKAVLAGEYGDAYWLAWDSVDIRIPGRNRINLSEEVWKNYAIGDRIEVRYFPDDIWPYAKEDIYASNGNFAFDGALLAAWMSGIVTLVCFQARHVRRVRNPRPPPLPRDV